ncbi:MAG: glycine--tRNA ligase [Candidatus Woesearchaeota archaeon]
MSLKASIEEIAVYCKKKGFVYKNSEIYGGLAGIHDYGPLGVEMKRNIQDHWWNTFVRKREDIVGIDGATISSSKVWEASGHLSSFTDPLIMDAKTKKYYRADHLIEDALSIPTDGKSKEELLKIIQDNNLKSPEGNELGEITSFNLMFPINLGAKAESQTQAYLRGETAQNIFINYKNIIDTGRVKIPFGIAQVGRSYRNEISPRDFLYRQREFEIMEIEYFYNPNEDIDIDKGFLDKEILLLSAKAQEEGKSHSKTTYKNMVESGLLSLLHAYWLHQSYQWYVAIGIREENMRVREHVVKELSHYSSATFDIDYNFPFGWKEIYGIADRGNYDLKAHQEKSNKSMEVYNEDTKEKVLCHVIEPSFGLDRAFITIITDAYHDDKERGNIVMSLSPEISPYYATVMPLLSNNDELVSMARKVYDDMLSLGISTYYDKSGSIGRRYARQDEIGTPYCITIDHDSLQDNSVTVRDRDSKEQKRVKINELEYEIGWKKKRR